MVTTADEQKDLRRGVDHVGVNVCFVIHDGKGRILLQKRSQNTRDERGTWDIGGGAIEFGESIDDALKREIQEELGTEPLDVQFLEVGDAHRVNHEGDKTHWVYLLHAALVDPSKVKINEPDKIDEIGWFTLDNLPEPMHSMFPKVIAPARKAGIVR